MATSRPLAGQAIALAEDLYAHDLALHDRFKEFSDQLLKITLIGLGVFAFFFTNDADKSSLLVGALQRNCEVRLFLSVAAVSFVLAAWAALRHRFLSSDAMFHHIRALKLITLNNPALSVKIAIDEEKRTDKLKWAEKFIYTSAALLALGTLFLAIAFIFTLKELSPKSEQKNPPSQPAATAPAAQP